MGDPVFANGMQISSKSMSGKSICEFPDVCFTPPQTPATPPGVPLPYPNTAMASDTSDGSKSVQIGGQEVMLKDTSFFKQSTGDEAGSAPQKGLMTSTNKGSAYFIAWSMTVKVEGENVVRNLDMTTHNHGSKNATGLAPTVHAAEAAMGEFENECSDDIEKLDKCTDEKKVQCPGALGKTVTEQRDRYSDSVGASRTEQAAAQATADAEGSDCVKAMRCFLRPHTPGKKQTGCCPGQTPHHIPPKSCFKNSKGKYPSGYKPGSALCVCMEGANQHVGSHGQNHAAIDYLAGEVHGLEHNDKCALGDYNKICAAAVAQQCNCNAKCIEKQLNESLKDVKPQEVKHKKIGSEQDIDKTELKKELNALKKRPIPR